MAGMIDINVEGVDRGVTQSLLQLMSVVYDTVASWGPECAHGCSRQVDLATCSHIHIMYKMYLCLSIW